MKKACVIGWPIEHSRSPLIHGHWLRRYKIDGHYDKRAVEPDRAAEFLATLAQQGLVGCNVTVPLKEIAVRCADVVHGAAKAVGAANTLWLEDGKLHATNTDTYGFMTHLSTSVPGWRDTTKSVVILGAGGAARAIIYGFLEAGVSEVRIVNRTRERAENLRSHFGSSARVFDWDDRSQASSDAGVVVNTTSIGMNDQGDLDMDFNNINPDCVVCDIVYVPLQTKFLRAASAKGLRTVDGLGMLLHQAVPGFEKWFGVRPDVTSELRDLMLADLSAS